MQVLPVTPSEAGLFDEWYDVYACADAHGRTEAASYTHQDLTVFLTEPALEWRHELYAGLVDGRVVAAGWLSFPLLDNRWRGDVEVYVPPDVRRRGHGSAMLAHLEQLVRAEGRNLLLSEVAWPYADGADGSGPGVAFARARGFELALGDVQRRLTPPVPDEDLDRLAAAAAPHHAGYELSSWTGPIPDHLVEEWAELNASLDTEAPTGELEIEPQSADVAAVREEERIKALQRRVSLHTVARRPDGRLAAYTELVVPTLQPGLAYQWGTLVRRGDRGHRLGVAVKVANLRHLQRTRPEVSRVVTFNAEVNEHMIAVNEALGFVPVERLGEFQKKLSG